MSEAAPKPLTTYLPGEQLTRLESIEAITTIDTAEGERVAVDGLAFIQTIMRNLEKARKELVQPLNDRVKQVNDGFRPMTNRLAKIEEDTKAAIVDWRKRERERIAAEEARVRRENEERERLAAEQLERERTEVFNKTLVEAEDAGFDTTEAAELAQLETADVAPVAIIREVAPAPVANMTKGTLGNAIGRMVWKFKVTDPWQVPRAYLAVDEAKIRKAMNDGVRDMPGVIFWEEEQIAGRSAS